MRKTVAKRIRTAVVANVTAEFHEVVGKPRNAKERDALKDEISTRYRRTKKDYTRHLITL